MSKLFRRAYAVFKSYFVSDIVRRKGFIYVLLSFSFWIILFITPVSLFIERDVDRSVVSTYAFASVLIFMAYSVASWDWAAEIRWMINDGTLEYYIATGSGILPHYLGILPISMMWLTLALTINYAVLALVFGSPRIVVQDPIVFILALIMLIMVLLGYALLLGGTMISTGTSGFIIEILSFILPIATGGLTPLSRLPPTVRAFALSTPFSYPAELIRYSLLGLELTLSLAETMVVGYVYSAIFLAVGVVYFRSQLKKCLKNGFVQASLW